MSDNVLSKFLPYIPPSPSSSTPRRLHSIFPALSTSIHNGRFHSSLEGLSSGANIMDIAVAIDHHNDDYGSSAMLGAQTPEDFNYEAFDFDDEDDLPTPDDTTAAEAAVPQDDINQLNPVASVKPALENGPPSSEQAISEADALTNDSSPQNDLAISAAIPPHIATTLARDDATHLHSAEEAHNSEPINTDDASVTHLQNDSVISDPVLCTPSTRSSSPALSYCDDEDPDEPTQLSQTLLGNDVPIPHTTLDPNILMAHDQEQEPPITSRPSTPATEPPTQNLLDGSPLESDHPQTTQTMVESWQSLLTEDEEAREPAASDTFNEVLNDKEPDDAVDSRCSNTGSSKDRRDSFTSETHESIDSRQWSPQPSPQSDLESLHDINDPNEQYNIDTAAFMLPIDIIPVTPSGSPILEGLLRYMVPEAHQDNVSTPVQRDIPTGEPDPPYLHHPSHVQVRDSPTSPFEDIQSGSLHLMPTYFALSRENYAHLRL